MKRINLLIRFKNPIFIIQLILAVLTPILAYAGLKAEDLTTLDTLLKVLIDALGNPYVLSLVFVSVWNAVNDPTTPGITDNRGRSVDENSD